MVFAVRFQFIPQIRALEPITTAIPLAIVLGITAVKDLIDDIVSQQHFNSVNLMHQAGFSYSMDQSVGWLAGCLTGDSCRVKIDNYHSADSPPVSSWKSTLSRITAFVSPECRYHRIEYS